MEATVEFSKRIGKVPACEALGTSRASLYRRLRPVPKAAMQRRSHRALSCEERQQVLEVLHSKRFVD